MSRVVPASGRRGPCSVAEVVLLRPARSGAGKRRAPRTQLSSNSCARARMANGETNQVEPSAYLGDLVAQIPGDPSEILSDLLPIKRFQRRPNA